MSTRIRNETKPISFDEFMDGKVSIFLKDLKKNREEGRLPVKPEAEEDIPEPVEVAEKFNITSATSFSNQGVIHVTSFDDNSVIKWYAKGKKITFDTDLSVDDLYSVIRQLFRRQS